jgi:hypothetical protein
MRCMLLLAEGHSYRQIQEITGYSYTKVNRCLTEGRRSFMRRVEGIESGAECERLAPLLSAMADGEASAQDMAALRPHLRTCLSCRAALRDAREAPGLAAALAPVGFLAGVPSLTGGGEGTAHGWHALVDWLHERTASLFLRGQELAEMASAHKLAAAASAAALAGGGAAAVHPSGPHADQHPDRRHTAAHEVRPAPVRAAVETPRVAQAAPAPLRATGRRAHRAAAKRATAASPPPPSPAQQPSTEFEAAAAEPEPAAPAPQAPEPKPSNGHTGEFGP